MARQFNGTSDYLVSAANIDLTAVSTSAITIACWLWWDAYDDLNDHALELSADFDANVGVFDLRPNWDASAFLFAHKGDAPAGYRAASIARPSAAAWHHYLCRIATDTTANIAVYVDGLSVSVTSNQNTGGGAWGTFLMYVMAHGGASLFAAGRMADLAIWSGDRTSYASLLAAGARAASMVVAPLYAWRIDGTSSPEPNSHGGVNLTVNGATFVADPAPLAARSFLLVR